MTMIIGRSLSRRFSTFTAASAVLIIVITVAFGSLSVSGNDSVEATRRGYSASHRKLLQGGTTSKTGSTAPGAGGALAVARAESKVAEPNRIWGDKCSKSDIVIHQGPTSPLPNGIPTYTVEIMNACPTGCNISAIHLSCGWFSSARLINPRIFKRLRFNDCLVNDGKPLINGRIIYFQYANTFSYPLSVSSIIC